MRKLLLGAAVAGALTPAATTALGADNVKRTTTEPTSGAPEAAHSFKARTYEMHAGAPPIHRRHRRHRRRAQRAVAVPAALQAIAACESGGNPHAIGGGGAFRGKYQFDYGTWASVGGHGDPAAAPEPEQDRRAAMLYAREGTTPWPVCGGRA